MWDGSPEARSKEPEKWRQCVKHTNKEMIGGIDEFLAGSDIEMYIDQKEE